MWSNHEVSFFKKMIAKMGWTYSESDVTFADGLTDWTATPAPAAEGETVTLNYSGKKKVKSITVTNQ